MIDTKPYLLSNVAAQAEDRFAALSALFDHTTFRHLDAVGISPGWRCWEVGAGGLSVPSWMAGRVGLQGRVVATDIDTSWLAGDMQDIGVYVHDVGADEPPAGGFDLVHARLVLTHVPERERALENMVAALRPGGWLVLEDFDTALIVNACLNPTTHNEHLANKMRQGFLRLLAARGVDLEYGRKLPGLLRAANLTSVGADAFFPVTQPAARVLEQANTNQVGAHLVAGGHATYDEIASHLSALAAGAIDVGTPPLISAWGRKPADR
jgi:SAM-dependent methyltransferase